MSMKRVMSPKSLNQTLRKKKLVQIAEENQFLLRRLQDKKSNYDIIQFEQQWMGTKNFQTTIQGQSKTQRQSYYGNSPSNSDNVLNGNHSFSNSRNNSLNPIKRRSMKLNSTQLENNLYGQPNSDISNQNVNTSMNGSLTSNFRISQPKRGSSANSGTNSASLTKRNLTSISNNVNSNFNQKKEKIRLYKQVKVIGNIHFDVEVYMYDTKMMIIADEIEGDETKIIEIPQEEALTFLREECDNDLDSLVLRLRHANNQLFLIGTKKSREKAQQNSGNKSHQESAEEPTNAMGISRNQQAKEHSDNSKRLQEGIQRQEVGGVSSIQSDKAGSLQERVGSNKNYQTFQPQNASGTLQQNSKYSYQNNNNNNNNNERASGQFTGGFNNNTNNNTNSNHFRNSNKDIHENIDDHNNVHKKSIRDDEYDDDYLDSNSAHQSNLNSLSKLQKQTNQKQQQVNSQQSRRNDNAFEDNSPEKFVYQNGQNKFEEEYEDEEQGQNGFEEEQVDDEEEEEEDDGKYQQSFNKLQQQNQDDLNIIQSNNKNTSDSKYHQQNSHNSFALREEEYNQ